MRVGPIHKIRSLIAICVVPILLLTTGGVAHALYRCSYDKVARTNCCCPKQDLKVPSKNGSPISTVKAATCCDVIRTPAPAHTVVTPAARVDFDDLRPILVCVAELVRPSVSLPAARITPTESARPPPAGTELLIRKQVFLI